MCGKKNIYCNVHWRLKEEQHCGEYANMLSNTILTIPCDQRYGYSHMDYIVECVKMWSAGEI